MVSKLFPACTLILRCDHSFTHRGNQLLRRPRNRPLGEVLALRLHVAHQPLHLAPSVVLHLCAPKRDPNVVEQAIAVRLVVAVKDGHHLAPVHILATLPLLRLVGESQPDSQRVVVGASSPRCGLTLARNGGAVHAIAEPIARPARRLLHGGR